MEMLVYVGEAAMALDLDTQAVKTLVISKYLYITWLEYRVMKTTSTNNSTQQWLNS